MLLRAKRQAERALIASGLGHTILELSALRKLARRRGFGAYEGMLFLEMIADVGYDCDPGPARELIGRELTSERATSVP